MPHRRRDVFVVGLIGLLALLSLVLWLKGPGSGWRSGPEARPASVAAPSEAFALGACGSRLFDDQPALAVVLSQPVDAKQELGPLLRVTDLGPVPGAVVSGGSAPQADAASASASASASAGDAAAASDAGAGSDGGRVLGGSWVVGENPRIVYFPYVPPQRRLRIDVGAGLRSIDGQELGAATQCETASEAMPASFQFASNGVVLPAGQNGGLPIVTVNVPEVDIEFLRIEPAALARFIERVAGSRKPRLERDDETAGGVDDEDGGDEDGYGGIPRRMQGLLGAWQLDALKDAARSVHLGRWRTDERPDRRHVSFIDVESIRELREPGVYVAVMSQPGRYRSEYEVGYFYVSDIGLHVRRYPRGLAAFVTSLRSGEAIGDVRLSLLDAEARTLAEARSDAQGQAGFDTVPAGARLLVARRGARELSLVALNAPALDLSEFDVGGHPSRAVELFAYAGRDLYRPGERFRLSVLARGADGRVIEPVPIEAVLKRPDGRTVRQSSWPVDPQQPGYFEQAIELPGDAPTGRWTLELRQDPAARLPDTVWSFQVEEFLPERMKLQLQHDAPVLGPEDRFEVEVQGDYLFGAPAAGNRLVASAAIERLRLALPQAWPGYVFGDVDDDARKGREEVEDTELDAQGHARVELPTRPGLGPAGGRPLNSPMLLRGSFSLLESGGRPVVRSIERPLWPAAELIGVRPLFDRDVAEEGQAAGFELVRVDAQGRFVPLPAGAPATLRLIREDRSYHWRHDDQKGWHAGYTEVDEPVADARLALRERERVSLPVGYGRYRLEVQDPQTGLMLRYRFYAGWSAQDAELIGNRPDRVQLQVEGLPLKPGAQSLRATLRPPHDGEALVTLEGDQLLWSRRLPVSAAGTEIEIPVDPSWNRHDLYLGVTAFRPGSQGRLVTPSRAVGLMHLPVARDERRLAVHLEAPAQVLPERRALVQVQVDGVQGAPRARVTLSAVDVGILEITRYRTPDPVDRFFGKHRYAAELHDLYGRLIEKMEGRAARLRFGGDSSARDTRSLPKKVQLVDLFSGPVALDAQGRAQIPIDVPDFNGRLRLMAVAYTADRYGSAEAEMVSAAPVVAELAMPRFIAPGDRATVALDLSNLSGATQELRVTLAGERPLHIAEGSASLVLADRQRRTLRFAVEALEPEGLGRLQLAVDARPQAGGSAAPIAIRREAALQVLPPVPVQREARRLRIEPGSEVALEAPLLAGLHPGSAQVSLALSNRPPLNLASLVQGLLRYPYGCTEQTTSAAYPWVQIDADTARALGLPAFSEAQRRQAIDGAIGRLAGLQRSGGGWSLWGEGGTPDLWLGAYVMGFLQDAREAGAAVPEAVLKRGREQLLQQLLQTPNRFPEWPSALRAAVTARASGPVPAVASGAASAGRAAVASAASAPGHADAAPPVSARDLDLLRDGHQRFAELAHAGYVLAREQQAPLATLRVLHDRYRDRARSPLPLVQLSIALRLMGDAPRADAALQDAMARPYGVNAAFAPAAWPGSGSGDEWLGDYGSRVRDLALAYALLLQHDIAHPRREQWLFEVSQLLVGRRYLSTQERYALFEAGRRAGLAAVRNPDGWQARLVNGSEEALQSNRTAELPIDAQRWSQGRPPRLLNTGTSALYAELEVSGYPSRPPEPRRDVIELERRWYSADGRPWTGREPRVGEMLVVELRARARMRMDEALIVDRVPAGFEIENLNLSQGPKAESFVVGGVDVGEAMADARIRHREFRDDRFVAAAKLDRDPLSVFYLVRVVSPGRFVVPAPYAEDMYRPELYGLGVPGEAVTIVDPQGER